MIGLQVVDSDGIELGYVSQESPEALVLGEGTSGMLRLGRRYVERIEDRVYLRGPLADIFANLNVVDSDGEFVGVVRDTVEGEESLDSLIVEDEQGEMVNVAVEDVRSIDEWIELSVSGDDLSES